MEEELDDVPDTPSGPSLGPVDSLQVLEVSPSEFRIQCQLNTEVSYIFTLRNITDRCVAFKVKTTAPRRYMVRPAQGTILSGEEAPITIVLVKMSQYPDQSNPRSTRDKFLVQSFALEHELTGDDLNSLWISKEKEHNPRANHRAYYEHRLKCRLLIPSETSHEYQSGPVSAASPVASNPFIEQGESNLDITVSPPEVPKMELETSTIKPTSVSDVEKPSEDVSEVVPTKDRPSTGEQDPKSNIPQPTPSQPFSTNAQEKEDPPSRKKSNAPLLANHPKEYEKMLAFSVKLTVEREALENKIAKLSEHNAFLLQENERLRKSLAIEQGNSVAASSVPSRTESRRSVLDALQPSEGKHGVFEPDFDFSESHANLVASQLAVNSGIQLWQVLAVAALCFLIGRVL